jgi:glycosyltransferase involved in cell wall biosynthesis
MEGVPTVLMEAMSCEVPVISTTISGIPELVHSHVTGLLVPPKDPASLKSAIAALAADPHLRQAMGKAGRQYVEQNYNLMKNTMKKAQLFQDASESVMC